MSNFVPLNILRISISLQNLFGKFVFAKPTCQTLFEISSRKGSISKRRGGSLTSNNGIEFSCAQTLKLI